MARTSYQHSWITALEIDGKPVQIASAELTRVSMLDSDDEVINMDWEVNGKATSEVTAGVHALAMTIGDRTHRQRAVFKETHADGWWVFKGVGLDQLEQVE
jgi:hypothetical protein